MGTGHSSIAILIRQVDTLLSRLFLMMILPTVAVVGAVGLLAPLMPNLAGQLGIAAGGIVLILLSARWIARDVDGRIAAIAGVVDALREGRRADRLSDGTDDEIGRLATVVNRLSEGLSRQQHEQRRRSEGSESTSQLLQAVLKTMVEGVVVIDADQRLLFTNEAARPLLDFATRDVLGKRIWEVARSPQIQDVVGRLLESHEPLHAEFELPRTKSVVSLNGAALPSDPVPGVVIVLHDITELRRLENIRRDFVTNVSHELKTPLTSIQAYADTLASGAVDDPDRAREFLERILDQSDRLYRLILDLLQLAKIESEAETFVAEHVDVAEVIEECIGGQADIAEGKQITVRLRPLGSRVVALVGRRELRTILDNLINNSLTYTPEGGQVRVAWSADAGRARISVTDTGIGISRDQQSRVFERFYRVDRARDRKRGGTGLGLAIVKNLTQVFDGQVDVQSEQGKGTTFTLWFPLAVKVRPTAATSARTADSSESP